MCFLLFVGDLVEMLQASLFHLCLLVKHFYIHFILIMWQQITPCFKCLHFFLQDFSFFSYVLCPPCNAARQPSLSSNHYWPCYVFLAASFTGQIFAGRMSEYTDLKENMALLQRSLCFSVEMRSKLVFSHVKFVHPGVLVSPSLLQL